MKHINLNTILNILLVGLIGFYIARYFYFQPKFASGEPVPDFTAETIDGNTFHLSELRGKYVLVDFWGSWCGPCRRENPNLVNLYKKYQGKNFEIVSIAIEKDKRRWERAIQKDNLFWPYHIVDLSSSMKFFDSELAKLFGVKQIPSKYLLNPNGVIVGVNQSVEEIDQQLQAKN